MTAIQIACILQLLIAFGVGQPTVDKVALILIPPVEQSANTPVVVPTPQLEPQFSGTIQSVTPTPVDHSGITVEPNGNRYIVRVLDTNGKAVKDADIYLDAPDMAQLSRTQGIRQRYANNVTATNKEDYHAVFVYSPITQGSQTLTFTSGELTKSVTIEVQ